MAHPNTAQSDIVKRNDRIHPAFKPRTYQFQRGEHLPDYGELIWQITSGYVRTMTWSREGEITTLGIWGPTSKTIPCVAHRFSQVRPYQIECLTPVSAVLHAYPLQRLPELLLTYAQETEKLLVLSQHRQVGNRLRLLLGWLADRFGEPVSEGKLLKLGLTHQQFADLAGLTRVTVTRLINQLEAQGEIRRLPKRQVILLSKS